MVVAPCLTFARRLFVQGLGQLGPFPQSGQATSRTPACMFVPERRPVHGHLSWVPILEIAVLRKTLSTPTILQKMAAFAGLWIISSPRGLQIEIGHLLVIISSIFSALQILSIDRLGNKSDPLTLTTVQIATMTLLSIFGCVLLGKETIPTRINASLIAALLVTSLFATSLACWIQTSFQSRTSPERAATIYNLEPVFAAIFSLWLLGEDIYANTLTGGVAILAAMMITSLPQRSRSLRSGD
ncbi:EamA-like transporter family protein [compost metagenome]